MIAETFDDIYRMLVENQFNYIEHVGNRDKELIYGQMGLKDHHSNWNICNRIYDFTCKNYYINNQKLITFNNNYSDKYCGATLVMNQRLAGSVDDNPDSIINLGTLKEKDLMFVSAISVPFILPWTMNYYSYFGDILVYNKKTKEAKSLRVFE